MSTLAATKTTARPTKLRNGNWGATVTTPGVGLSEGDTVTITTKAGKSWVATVEKIVWKKIEGGKNVYIVATASLDRPRMSGPRPSRANNWTPRSCEDCQDVEDMGDALGCASHRGNPRN